MTIENNTRFEGLENKATGADFGHIPPFEARMARTGDSQMQLTPEMAAAVDAIADTITNIQQRLTRVLSASNGQFDDVIAGWRQHANNGEPAYEALFGNKIS